MRPLSRDEVRSVDARAIGEWHVPGIVLMENAGRGAAELLHRLAGVPGRVAIACGRGNNGGDGFVIARHLENLGHEVRILLACDPATIEGDAAINRAIVERAGIPLLPLAGAGEAAWLAAIGPADWIVDALLGTGASGPPRGAVAAAIRAIVAARSRPGGPRVLAVDLPSGLDCDSGQAPGDCVRADATATFVAPKLGFDAPGAEAFTGAVHVVGIGVPRRLLEAVAAGERAALTRARATGRSSPGRP